MDNNPSPIEEEKNAVSDESEAVQDNTSSDAEKTDTKKHLTRAEKKQAKRERKARWKEKKKTRRDDLKSYYSDAPWIVRFSRLYLTRVIAVVLIVAIVILIPSVTVSVMSRINSSNNSARPEDEPVSKEEIYEISPLDEKGAARIDTLSPGSAEDTWAVYVYLVGANLEDLGQDSLSDLVREISGKEKEEQAKLTLDKREKLLEDYLDVLDKNGLEPPLFLYEPKDYIEPVPSQPREYSPYSPGAATADLNEMMTDTNSDKLSVVVQTGGARKWNSKLINPNRTQRICIRNGLVDVEESLPLQRASDPDTLADFLRFCKEKHPADHTILVLWDHGGGPFGYGNDYVFGGLLSIADVRDAIDEVYDPDPDSPPFDIIGYDACLMGNLDVLHSLEGFADYYVMSEQSEPAQGWNYTPWLTEIAEHPETNPAQIARMIVDSYTDYYMELNVRNKGSEYFITRNVTMSLIDAKKCAELYNAYCGLAKKQLIDSVNDISVLAEIGRAGHNSTCYATSDYNVYNLIDLGNYIDNLKEAYPDECALIGRLLDESVIYHRENGNLSDSTGISIYLPAFINSYRGTLNLLDYVFNICDDESIKTLYFYKNVGCLTDDMKAYVRSLTSSAPATLSTALFKAYEDTAPVIDGNRFSVPVDPGIQNMITSYYILLASISVDTRSMIYYGTDALAETDVAGNITSGKYDGKWICLDDQPLSPEITSSSASTVEYRAKVLKDDVPVYLLFSYDRNTGVFTIDGTKPYTSEDNEYESINLKVNSESVVGSTIVPVYEAVSDSAANIYEMEGVPVKCTESTVITRKAMKDSIYLVGAVIVDQRGDEYCSEILLGEMSDGKLNGFLSFDEYAASLEK
ncbi:MAG: hypothetical protein IK093_00220 [Ruminiclostridium sp.]|nr:hypothetical protein [Ruminiclostridium sp.]